MIFDWTVLARQAALIFVPLLLSWLRLPQTIVDMISGPVADLLATGLVLAGTALVGWIVWLGQRREKPKNKIEEVAKLPEVAAVVTTPEIAAKIDDDTVKSAPSVVIQKVDVVDMVKP